MIIIEWEIIIKLTLKTKPRNLHNAYNYTNFPLNFMIKERQQDIIYAFSTMNTLKIFFGFDRVHVWNSICKPCKFLS